MDRMQDAGEIGAAAATAAASTVAGAKAAALVGSAGAAVLGAGLMVMIDPPTTRRGRYLQAFVGSVFGVIGGPIAIIALDHYVDWIDLGNADWKFAVAVAAPMFLITGALGWGVAGAIAHLRRRAAEQGGDAIAHRLGMDDEEPKP